MLSVAVIELIKELIQCQNQDYKPFVRTAQAEAVLVRVARERATLDKTPPM
jgi:hypothetical protein